MVVPQVLDGLFHGKSVFKINDLVVQLFSEISILQRNANG